MIQKWIKEQLQGNFPHLEWTMDYKTGEDFTAVVYMETAGEPSNDDFRVLYPTYMIELVSSNLAELESIAWKVYEEMDGRQRELANIDGRTFEILQIRGVPPLNLGIEDRKQTFTVNLQATLLKTN